MNVMKFTQRATIVALSAATYTSNVHATNFIIFQPDDMRFYKDWSPPAHLPWDNDVYPGEEYPMYSNLPWINKLRNNGMTITMRIRVLPSVALHDTLQLQDDIQLDHHYYVRLHGGMEPILPMQSCQRPSLKILMI